MRRGTTRRLRLPGLMRLWRPDGNPLRRTTDRVEGFAVAVLIGAFLTGAPAAALAAGHAAAAGGSRTVHAQASWHRVPAVLLRKAPARPHPMFQATLDPLVPARWRTPDGTSHTGKVFAPQGAAAGSTVEIWTDGAGRQTASPVQEGDVITGTVLAAGLATVGVAALLVALGLLIRWLLDRRRLAAWHAHWESTGPQWTGRT
jgi:hypothetical protein